LDEATDSQAVMVSAIEMLNIIHFVKAYLDFLAFNGIKGIREMIDLIQVLLSWQSILDNDYGIIAQKIPV